jgi:hypothetical protein
MGDRHSAMTEFHPHIHPDGHVGFDCPWCNQPYQLNIEEYFKSDEEEDKYVYSLIAKCDTCKKSFRVRYDGAVAKVHSRWMTALIKTGRVVVLPFLWLDMNINSILNKVSVFIQKLTTLSKYWLPLITIIFGLLFMYVGSLFMSLVWVFILWRQIAWLVRKGRNNSNVSAEVIDPADVSVLNATVFNRLLISLMLILYFIGLVLTLFDSFSEFWTADKIGFILIYIGLHWLTSSYLPPWQRKLMESFQALESDA